MKVAVKPASAGMSAFAGLLTGLAGAYVVALAGFCLPILSLVVAPIYGRFVADAVLSFSGDVRGRKVEALGVGSVLLGSFVALGTPLGTARMASPSSVTDLSQAIIGVSIGIAVVICYNRLKPVQS